MEAKLKTIYIGFAFEHHKNTQAGYHHIKDYLKYDKIINCQKEFDFVTKKSRENICFRCIYFLYRKLLGRGCPLTILYCIFISLFNKNIIFHFIYGENTYKWLHRFKGKTNKIICTFHQPADIFMLHPEWIRDLKHLDGIILMSSKDIEIFEKWSMKKNIKYIPHGINTDFYSPEESIKKTNDILMVGNWLRNFEFANNVFSELLQLDDSLIITIVTNFTNFKNFNENKRVKLLSSISDETLRDLYRTSRIVFLPLNLYTANNAILEAASTNCYIIIATNQIDNSYFNKEQITLLPMDKEIVIYYLKNKENPKVTLREYVIQNFSWQHIALETKKFFNNLVK